MDDHPLASDAEQLLANIKRLLVETEALYSWSRRVTLALREEILNMQHDIELVQSLLPRIPVFTKDILEAAAGAFQSILAASIPAIRIVTDGVVSLARRLRTEDASVRPSLLLLISEKQSVISDTRENLLDAFGSLWLENWVSEDHINESLPEPSSSRLIQLKLLLDSFIRIPFSVGATDDAFMRGTPPTHAELLQLDQWQYDIERTSRHWLTNRAKNQDLNGIFETHRTFLSLLWVGCAKSHRNIDLRPFSGETSPLIQETIESIVTMRDGARDGLRRFSSPTWTIVFVGAEDSGKSTFINAFVGIDILPTAYGPTTAYPCRLRHSPGHEDPLLEFGTDYLNACLDELRRGEWASKVDALIDGEWDDTTPLPDEFKLEDLYSTWTEMLSDELPDKLHDFTEESFRFSSPVVGAENIEATLTDINKFVRICQNLPLGFNKLEPADWPLITMEFPRMKHQSLPDGLMLVDIPGLTGSRDSVWDETTREIIRAAAIVVALIALPSFHGSPWRQLPRIVRRRTGVDVGVVVLTKLDDLSIPAPNILASYQRLVRSIFWPAFPKEDDSSHLIITCSALAGPSLDNLKEKLEALPVKGSIPGWDFFSQKCYAEATRYLYGGDDEIAEKRFSREGYEDVMVRVRSGHRAISFQESFAKFLGVVTGVRKQSVLDHHGSLEVLTRGISFNLRTLMVLVGTAPGVPGLAPGSDIMARGVIREQMKLLDAWNVQFHAFHGEVRAIVVQARATLSKDMENCINTALSSAAEHLKPANRLTPLRVEDENAKPVQFDDIESIEKYMDHYRIAFEDLARVLDVATIEFVLAEANEVHGTLFGEMEDLLAIPRFSPQATMDDILPGVNADISKEALLQHVEVLRSRYTAGDAFSQVQLYILQKLDPSFSLEQHSKTHTIIDPKNEFRERVEQLRSVSRLLLAIASTIPFILTLPYWLQQTYVQAYTLSLQTLRPALLREVTSQTTTFLDLLEGQITAQALRHTQVVTQSKFPPSPHRGSISASLDANQRLIAASANIIGLSAVTETMQKLLFQRVNT